MVTTEERKCPVCNGSKKVLLFHQSFSGFSDNNLLTSYDVVSCEDCGTCFADNIPSQDHFDRYYRDQSKYENVGEEIKESPYDVNRFKITISYLEQFLDKVGD
jgi:hypothetical protein